MKWFSNLFKLAPLEVVRAPVAGETWVFSPHDDSPWPVESPNVAIKILDSRGGWVRYDMGAVFRDERLPLETFLKMYKPEDQNENK